MNIQKKLKFYQKVAWVMIFLMVYQLSFPTIASALTSGPTQPEVQGFEPVGTTQMVDPFTGDFNYNIPLFDLPGPDGGYPFNLAYHAGITMDQEASWVGLGWSLNPGAITRSMRGIPDEFNGDKVTVIEDMKPNNTWNFGIGGEYELFGFGLGANILDVTGSNHDIGESFNAVLGFSATLNSYTGWSMSINPGLSTGTYKGVSSPLGLSLSQKDGVGLSMSLMGPIGGITGSYKSAMGLTSISYQYALNGNERTDEAGAPYSFGISTGGSISMNGYSYTPEAGIPWNTVPFSGSFHGGFDALGTDWGANLNVAGSKQTIKEKIQELNAYGYLNLENGDETSMKDFNREKDGMIYPHTPNLSTPILTHDIYSVVGQGIGTMYRPVRSDIGIVGNRLVESNGGGGGFGLEGDWGGLSFKFGVDVDVNWSNSTSQKWNPTNNTDINKMEFDDAKSLADYEKYYFQSASEIVAEYIDNYKYIGGNNAARLKLRDVFSNDDNDGQLGLEDLKLHDDGVFETKDAFEPRMNDNVEINNFDMHRKKRRQRSSAIQPITNKNLMDGNDEVLGHYDIGYYPVTEVNDYRNTSYQPNNFSNEENARQQSNFKDNHIAGFTAIQPGGLRYVYGLPVYNTKQDDYVFTSDGLDENNNYAKCGPTVPIKQTNAAINSNYNDRLTDIEYQYENDAIRREEYFKKTSLPEYTHSHLLTSVLGADYIDLTNDGPTDDDYGYWVKFNYVKTTTGGSSGKYKWRTPYFDANFIQGVRNRKEDDKANLSYGEREQYYLATAETKTHIAEFHISPREDALGATGLFPNIADFIADSYKSNAQRSYKLDSVLIFSKLEIEQKGTNAVPLKRVHLDYDYSLCKGVHNHMSYNGNENSPSSQSGKLTLKSLSFTYGNNTRGQLSPYNFDYHEDDLTENPNYHLRRYDKWAMYKPNGGAGEDICDNQYFPYVKQYDYNFPSATAFREKMDKNASVWSLKEINLPSGANISIDYEIDDYGYEQNRVATQMMKVIGVSENNGQYGTQISQGDVSLLSQRRIYFELEEEIPNGIAQEKLDKYFEDLYTDEQGERQMYYKVMMDLKASNDAWEFVEGYVKLEDDDASGNPPWHPVLSSGSSGKVKHAWVEVKGVSLETDTENEIYHPFSATAWQQLRILLPNQIYEGNNTDGDPDGDLTVEQITKFASIWNQLKNIFGGYYSYCRDRGYGVDINPARSFVKLNSPDKQKLGGGSRVKQITFDDKWDNTEAKTVGQVFDYTTEENGEVISSGVLTKEPALGGEESALRYAKIYPQGSLLKTENLFFAEGPFNESYFPGASVGYSKVTVKSLATHYAMEKAKANSNVTIPNLPEKFATTGFTINEFYTAKDFPVITNETELDARHRPIILPAPFRSIRDELYTGSQGYSIELNDMHGKPYRVTHYGLDEDNHPLPSFASRTVFNYYDKAIVKNKRSARQLVNTVPIILSDGVSTDETAEIVETDGSNPMQLGVDYEFFVDMRETESLQSRASLGLNINTLAFFPITNIAPAYATVHNHMKTAVTNKIIRKKGILKSVEAYDESSKIVTTNKLFDGLTGAPLLTTVVNEYDDLVYNYSIPARWEYDGMDAAYKNIGMKYTVASIANTEHALGGFQFNTIASKNEVGADIDKHLVPGDEFIVSRFGVPQGIATFIKERSSIYLFDISHSDNLQGLSGGIELLLIRSGRRNHIGTTIASITALNNPTENREVVSSITGNIDYPKDINGTLDNESVTMSTYKYKTDHSKILSASAALFKDNWALSDDVNCTNSSITPQSGYTTGELGVWRPYRSYAYLTDIQADDDINKMKLQEDGIYEDFVMFNWKNPFFGDCDGHDWKLMGESTLYNRNGYGLESRDALGLYSSALYGYNDNLSTAVAANARYSEIAFDGFEEYSTGTLNQVTSNSNACHLDIVSPCDISVNQKLSETHTVISSIYKSLIPNGTKLYAIIDKEYINGMAQPDEVTANVTDQNGQRHTSKLNVTAMSPIQINKDYGLYYNNPTMTLIEFDDPHGCLPSFVLDAATNTNVPALFNGQLTLHFDLNTSVAGQGNTKVEISNERAHTGSNSLYIPNNANNATFNQNILQLQKGEEYVFSAWISEANMKQRQFKNASVVVNDGNIVPTGRVIDGWQRVEGTFVAKDLGSNYIKFKLLNLSTANNGFYIDDIRIFPKDGAIQTYVYNPTNYRLEATLDNNNYATFYIYDAEGGVIFIKKETKEGIVTVQEGRGHMKDTRN